MTSTSTHSFEQGHTVAAVEVVLWVVCIVKDRWGVEVFGGKSAVLMAYESAKVAYRISLRTLPVDLEDDSLFNWITRKSNSVCLSWRAIQGNDHP